MSDLVGQILLRRYRVDAFLGRGGMADVYRVWDSRRAVPLAMKVLREDLSQDHTFLHRFRREARVLESLQHPHIVRYYGLEQEDLLAFMLMDYIEGTTLRAEIFRRQAPFPSEEILRFMRPVCSALHYAHDQGVIHCDMKPANVLIDKAGRIYVSDFGIARLAESATVTFSTPGTPAYMSPEQCRGSDELDARTDIYALGVMLYELTAGGQRPFSGDTNQTTGSSGERIRWQHLHEAPPSPRQFNPDLSSGLEQIALHCLAKRPAERYPSAMGLLEALEQEIAQPASSIHTPTPQKTALRAEPAADLSSISVTPRRSQRAPGSTATVVTPRRNPVAWMFAAIAIIVLAVGGMALASTQAKLLAITQTAVALQQAQIAWAQATGTAQVQATGTAEAQATETAWAQETSTAQAQATKTVWAQETSTAQAQATDTSTVTPTPTATHTPTATDTPTATRTPTITPTRTKQPPLPVDRQVTGVFTASTINVNPGGEVTLSWDLQANQDFIFSVDLYQWALGARQPIIQSLANSVKQSSGTLQFFPRTKTTYELTIYYNDNAETPTVQKKSITVQMRP